MHITHTMVSHFSCTVIKYKSPLFQFSPLVYPFPFYHSRAQSLALSLSCHSRQLTLERSYTSLLLSRRVALHSWLCRASLTVKQDQQEMISSICYHECIDWIHIFVDSLSSLFSFLLIGLVYRPLMMGQKGGPPMLLSLHPLPSPPPWFVMRWLSQFFSIIWENL